MLEHEWWEYESPAALAEAVAGDLRYILAAAIAEEGRALAVLPGGALARELLGRLAAQELDWAAVTVVPSDDVMPAPGHAESHAATLARLLGPLGATVVPLTEGGGSSADAAAAARTANARLQALNWAPHCVLLSVSDEGGVGGLAAGSDLAAALEAPHLAVPVRARTAAGRPDRVVLSRAALLAGDAVILVLRGTAERRMLERAIADGPSSALPVGRFLAGAEQAMDIHWCP